MKRTLMVLITALAMGISGLASADDKPDCSEKQKAVDDAKAEAKAAGKPDLSSCKDMKECEKPLKAAAKDAAKAAKGKVKDASGALACCKNPKKKGC
jgi:hypothetical protein